MRLQGRDEPRHLCQLNTNTSLLCTFVHVLFLKCSVLSPVQLCVHGAAGEAAASSC